MGNIMRMTRTLPIAVLGVALLATGPVWAHHAMVAEFSLDKPVTLRGTLTKLLWINPHGWIYLDVKGADGQVENWAIETGGPGRMQKSGLRTTDFRIGRELIVGGFAAKDGSRHAAGMIVTFPDREALADRPASFALGR